MRYVNILDKKLLCVLLRCNCKMHKSCVVIQTLNERNILHTSLCITMKTCDTFVFGLRHTLRCDCISKCHNGKCKGLSTASSLRRERVTLSKVGPKKRWGWKKNGGAKKKGGLARSFMSMEFPFELGQESTAIISSGRNAKHFAMIV